MTKSSKDIPSIDNSFIRRGAHFFRRIPLKLVDLLSYERYKEQHQKKFLQTVLDNIMEMPSFSERIDLILSLKEEDSRLLARKVTADGEKALPGFSKFIEKGWSKAMITRYALAAYYCKDKIVLDSCCGLGWGSYLVEAKAEKVIALELNREAIELALELFPFERTLLVQGSVLDLALRDSSVDVALAMESIEHFNFDDIKRYLDELHRVLKPGGVLVGSSAFPKRREDVSAHVLNNPYHLHICTRDEIKSLLKSRFRRHRIYYNHRYITAWK